MLPVLLVCFDPLTHVLKIQEGDRLHNFISPLATLPPVDLRLLAVMVFEIYLCFMLSMCKFAKGNNP